MGIDLVLVARHGGLLALGLSAIVIIALRMNPRLFLRHFPPAVRASQPPLTGAEKVAGRVLGAALVVLLFGVPVWSARVAAMAEPYGRFEIFAHAFLVGMIFNLVDWLVLDELWLGLGRPQWALPPGVTLEDVPFSHAQHARGCAIGTALCAAVGLIALLVVSPR
jgi:hypothetical protein